MLSKWLSYGLNYYENRFSQLNQINTENVKDLGLVWSYELGSKRGVEATPIVVDGIMYLTAPWSIIYALDARTGKELWTYDPEVPKSYGEKACCDVVNRGVAIYKGKVFSATLDGRLLALDATTGEKIWETLTVDQSKPYTITGAPRVIKGNVIIGNGGAEYGVRGYLTAYNAETGEQAWRFYSVPGDPSKPYEDPALEMAAKTWDEKGEYWKVGGGGTMWDAMAYDPELNLMYVGVGNGSPWNRRHRSPGGGDNLFLSSIVALNPDDGKYKWHYQTTPGDHWDYTATQDLILADLKIEGKDRKVIMQAPKNGFFFVIDRTSGEFISAKNYVDVNWAEGYDEKGRPIEIPAAEYKEGAYEAIPGPYGAHNWHPMAFNPKTGLVYIPAQGIPAVIEDDKDWVYNSTASLAPNAGTGWNTGVLMSEQLPQTIPFGHLLAWDPIKQEAAWKVGHAAPWNGGILTTDGNLVFQGTADGRFIAFNAENGEKLWESPTGTGVIAAPSTYMVDGKQYITIAVGWGGTYGQNFIHSGTTTTGKVYTFAINGKAEMPSFQKVQLKPVVKDVAFNPELVPLGAKLYLNNCVMCHGLPGLGGGNIPNLGYVEKAKLENIGKYVLEGVSAEAGMPSFKDRLKEEDMEALKAFIVYQAGETEKLLQKMIQDKLSGK